MKKRRLIGPTLVSLVLCAVMADSLYFAEAPWSAVRLIKRISAGFAVIFAPVFDPANYPWMSAVAVPLSAVLITVVILSITVLRAKKAMRRATPQPDAPVLAVPSQASGGTKTLVPRLEEAVKIPKRSPGLLGKLTFSFCAVSVVFAIAAGAIAYDFLARVMDRQIKSRAGAVVFGINEIVTSRLREGRAQELSASIQKYATADGIAFVYVEDGEGRIIAHYPEDMPIYLDRDFPRSTEAALRGFSISYRGAPVYEVAERIDVNAGFVHLGLYSGAIEAESRRTFAPIAALVMILLIGSTAAFIAVARSVNRPLADLVRHADQISKGEFAVPLALKRADEIGEIARSLERLRSSLRAVVNRLEKEEWNQQQQSNR